MMGAIVTALWLAETPPVAAGVAEAAARDAAQTRTDVTVHDLSLANGFYTVRVTVPTAFPPPRPAVISFLGQEDDLLDAGLAVVTYQVHWELLKGVVGTPPTTTPPSPDAPRKTYGKWLLASSDPHKIGEGYVRLIVGNAEDVVPKVIDALSSLPDVNVHRLAIAGTSTNGFLVLQRR